MLDFLQRRCISYDFTLRNFKMQSETALLVLIFKSVTSSYWSVLVVAFIEYWAFLGLDRLS
jgi:hypothetical protein